MTTDTATSDDTRDAKPDAQSKKQGFKPVTFWLAGPAPLYPNPRIRVPGDLYPVHFRHGNATVTTQGQYDAVKRALGELAYEEDLPKNRKVRPCQTCGYAPRSSEAREAHDVCHPPVL